MLVGLRLLPRGRIIDHAVDSETACMSAANGHLFRYVIEVADSVIVRVPVVTGVPLVGASNRVRRGQGVAGWRGIGAVAADGDDLGIHWGAAAVVEERERDRAGLEGAARQDCRVFECSGSRTQGD